MANVSMKNLSVLIGLTSILTACGSKEIPYYRSSQKGPATFELGQLNVDPWLLESFMEFIHELEIRKKEYVLDFKDILVVDKIEENIVGRCTYFTKVEILRRDLLPYEIRLVTFHELGHCILKLNHEPINSNQIMQPSVIDDEVYIKNHWEDMVNTLMNSKNTTSLSIKDKGYSDGK